MRALIIAGAFLALAGCGNNDQTDNTTNVDENLAAENMVTNDVTAIDAVTADAANMAADVNYTAELDNGLGNTLDNAVKGASPRPSRPASRPSGASPAPASTNTVANSATNAAQ
jgi:hypothetical protein